MDQTTTTITAELTREATDNMTNPPRNIKPKLFASYTTKAAAIPGTTEARQLWRTCWAHIYRKDFKTLTLSVFCFSVISPSASLHHLLCLLCPFLHQVHWLRACSGMVAFYLIQGKTSSSLENNCSNIPTLSELTPAFSVPPFGAVRGGGRPLTGRTMAPWRPFRTALLLLYYNVPIDDRLPRCPKLTNTCSFANRCKNVVIPCHVFTFSA